MCNDKLIVKINQASENLPQSIKGFLNYLKIGNKSKHTILNYALDLKNWIQFQFVGSDNSEVSYSELENVTLDEIHSYVAKLNDDEKSNSTISRVIGTLKSFYKYLNEMKHISKDPTILLKMPKIERKLPKYLTEEECIKLLKSVDKKGGRNKERDFAILTLFLNTGMRLSELVDINLSDIHGDTVVVRGKGNKERELPLSESCLDAIKDYLRVREGDDVALFMSELGERVTDKAVQFIVKKYLNAIGKGNLSVHKLRHSCLTNFIKNGTDLRTVQVMAGHASVQTTEIYTHINNEIKKQAVNNTGLAKITRESLNTEKTNTNKKSNKNK